MNSWRVACVQSLPRIRVHAETLRASWVQIHLPRRYCCAFGGETFPLRCPPSLRSETLPLATLASLPPPTYKYVLTLQIWRTSE